MGYSGTGGSGSGGESNDEATTGAGGTPAWLDRGEYPFESHYTELGPGRLHYVDEGEGHPILMLHGNPTWSFLYRHLISGLSGEYRCIAPDYFGFGLSDKPRGWSYRPADHAAVVAEFVDELGLGDFTLVVHDWGGPIGLSYALDRPENVDSLVIQNTFMWPAERRSMRLLGLFLGSPIGRFLIREHNLFADEIMRIGFSNGRVLAPVHDQYLAPLATPDDRTASWVFPRELRGSREWLADLWERRAAIAGKPALVCWGTADAAFGVGDLRRWEALFPAARTVTFDAGHYVADEAGHAMVPEIRSFLADR